MNNYFMNENLQFLFFFQETKQNKKCQHFQRPNEIIANKNKKFLLKQAFSDAVDLFFF